jgi:hypothetical protein
VLQKLLEMFVMHYMVLNHLVEIIVPAAGGFFHDRMFIAHGEGA